MNLLYIGTDFRGRKTGGDLVRKNNYKLLKKIFKENMYDYFFKIYKGKKKALKNYLMLEFNGQTKNMEEEIFKIIEERSINSIFFDGSFYGNLNKKIKKKYNNIKIVTFFHNVEKNYYKSRMKVESFLYITAYFSIVYNEKLAIKYSDELILLNEREKKELIKNYRPLVKNKKINLVPIFLEDKYNEKEKIKKCDYNLLFIGSYFFANIQGISWFIKEVLPNINGKLVIIGNEMERLKKDFKDFPKLEIKGTVENLEEYYYSDNIIISPIFTGAGMKTKTIEAMMYNKTIIGTKEAFIGIKDIDKIGYECNTKEEFIELLKNNIEKKNSREIFLENYCESLIENSYKKMYMD